MRTHRSVPAILSTVLGVTAALILASPAFAQVVPDFVVTTTLDESDPNNADLSLREAIELANDVAGPQVIAFNIPATMMAGGVFTIRPLSCLPELRDDGTTIDGTTQTLFTGDTNPYGPEIELDGTNAGPCAGIAIGHSSNHLVRGLVIHTFHNAGVQFNWWWQMPGGPGHNRISGCYIGTDPTGSVALGNGWEGVALNGDGNVIGGPVPTDGNLISGNGLTAGPGDVLVGGGDSEWIGTVIENNRIGTDRTGSRRLSVTGDAILIASGGQTLVRRNQIAASNHALELTETRDNRIEDNLIGTDPAGTAPVGSGGTGIVIWADAEGTRVERNRIAFNGGSGIEVRGSSRLNLISRNAIFANGGLGIDLGSDGPTPNDPGDADSGPNDLQNYPVIASAIAYPGRLIVRGSIDTPRPNSVTLEFFANPVPSPGGDPSGYGEGAVYLGSGRPNATGTFNVSLPPVAAGTLISATARDAAGNTSEFSAHVAAQPVR